MRKILTAEEMREVDRLTTEKYGIPSLILMENAAHAAARVLIEEFGDIADFDVAIFCGKGNNGGDGAALARILWTLGANCFVYLDGKIEDTKGDARTNFEIVKSLANSNTRDAYTGIAFNENLAISDDPFDPITYEVVVDALFGTGLTRPLEGKYVEIIKAINNNRAERSSFVLSIDIPSGLQADCSGFNKVSVIADATITFTAPKLANAFPPALHRCGTVTTAEIGSPLELLETCRSFLCLSEKYDANQWLCATSFSENSYKNKRGNALLVVGSRNYSGAAALSGNAAMVTGVGLVTVATAESAHKIVAEKCLDEIIVRALPDDENGAISAEAFAQIAEISEKADVIAIGCGLDLTGGNPRVSKRASTEASENSTAFRQFVENRKTPILIDADGLNALSPFDLQGSDEFPLILTPHEGEFLRLLGVDDKTVLNDRIKAVHDFARKHKVILVLKGERVLISAPDGRVVINPTGNSGLGKAGNGDTLAGIITGFIAQAVQFKQDIFETVVAAVYLAGLAGDIAEEKFGKRQMLASDVRDCLKDAISKTRKK